MKKLKLSQPYASMVISGSLQTIPNIWGNCKYGEKIFIYAEDLDSEYSKEPDFSKTLHRKVYNDIFLGNLPDNLNDLPTHKYIGYVRIFHTGILQEGWGENQQSTLFIAYPYRFTNYIDDFNTNESELDKVSSRSVALKKIERKGNRLYVPVGKWVWQKLHDPIEYRNVCMFWEKYMEEFANLLFSFEDRFDDYVTEVHFQYRNNTISFETYTDIGQDIFTKTNTNEIIFILSFDQDYRINKNSIDIQAKNKYIESLKSNNGLVTEEEEEVASPKYNPYVRIISTPMGGMTKWKRKR